jgi:hypothetical protein
VNFTPLFVFEIAGGFMQMKSRIFYEKRTLKKYRIIFETDEMVIGADRRNKYRTFRKDTGAIAFSRREALELRINDLTKKQIKEAENFEKKRFNNLGNSAFGFNFG